MAAKRLSRIPNLDDPNLAGFLRLHRGRQKLKREPETSGRNRHRMRDLLAIGRGHGYLQRLY